jgi:hypothetical protein
MAPVLLPWCLIRSSRGGSPSSGSLSSEQRYVSICPFAFINLKAVAIWVASWGPKATEWEFRGRKRHSWFRASSRAITLVLQYADEKFADIKEQDPLHLLLYTPEGTIFSPGYLHLRPWQTISCVTLGDPFTSASAFPNLNFEYARCCSKSKLADCK